ncbi:major facilitator superfamily domain-containing protein [Mycena galopus ATCC 62051]|nr:major facilitator superfamily domain-containing protein [Mycena galopus ATCC 62051]
MRLPPIVLHSSLPPQCRLRAMKAEIVERSGQRLQAWATVAGSFLFMFCGFGYSTSFGVYQDFYVRTYLFHSSSSAISYTSRPWILLSLDVRRIFPRRTVSLHSFTGAAQPVYQVFLAHGIANGIGGGMTYVPSVAIISHHFKKRRAMAMTIVASGSSLGAVLHPIMLNHTLHSSMGFANAVRASAGLISGLLLIACFLVRTRLPPTKQPLNLWQSLRKFVRDKPYMTGTLGIGIYTIGFYYPLFYLQLDAVQHGIDPTFAFYAIVIMNAASFAGRLLPGLVLHVWGVKSMITVGSGCGAVLILSMIAIHNVASVVTIGIIYGFFAGGIVTLIGPLLAVLTDDMSELGARMGISFAFSGLGILIGPPIDGLLLTSDFIWWRPAVFSGVMAVVGFCLFVAMMVLHKRKSTASVVVELGLDP